MQSSNPIQRPNLYSVDLLNLHELTNAKIDMAIQMLQANNIAVEEDVIDEFYKTKELPWGRLGKMLNQKDSQQGLWLLALLLGINIHALKNDSNIITLIKRNDFLLKAVNIFLQHMINRDTYVSKMRSGNNCLNDALFCGNFSVSLTNLLILNGADPESENGDALTALAYYLYASSVEKESLIFSEFDNADKLRNTLVMALSNAKINALKVLELAELYGLFSKHDGILNREIFISDYEGSLLHIATLTQLESVINFLIEKGADLDCVDVDDEKPVDLALRYLLERNEIDERRINVIARLMVSSWKKNNIEISEDFVVDEVSKLNITNRECKIALVTAIHARHIMGCNYGIKISMYEKHQELNRDEITVSENDVIQSGSCGVIYKGMRLFDNQKTPVAIKFNKGAPSDDPYCHEISVHRQFKHENVIQYICDIERWGYKGIVMEYADSGALNEFILEWNYKTRKACFVSIATQTIAALKYLQTLNYVHLDLKPENILLKNSEAFGGQVLLADFGSSSKQGQTRSYCVTTWQYVSPEGCCVNLPYDYKHDVFSLGGVLGKIETAQTPWINFRDIDVIEQHVKSQFANGQRGRFNNVPMRPKVARLVEWCWKQDPKDRPDYDQLEAHFRSHF